MVLKEEEKPSCYQVQCTSSEGYSFMALSANLWALSSWPAASAAFAMSKLCIAASLFASLAIFVSVRCAQAQGGLWHAAADNAVKS